MIKPACTSAVDLQTTRGVTARRRRRSAPVLAMVLSGLVWTNAFLRKYIIETGTNPRILQIVMDLARNSGRSSSSAQTFCRSSLVARRLQALRMLYALQHAATRCNCNTLHHTCGNELTSKTSENILLPCCCNTPQHAATATHCICNTLQHTCGSEPTSVI